MSITATELKNNLGKYLILSATEDIFITKNGKIIAKLTNPYQDRVETAKSLFGILSKDVDLEEAKAERKKAASKTDFVIPSDVPPLNDATLRLVNRAKAESNQIK